MNRKQKAMQIYSQTNSIRKITKNHYAVESQNSDTTYNVRNCQKLTYGLVSVRIFILD